MNNKFKKISEAMIDFFEYANKVAPKAGHLLISEPYLADPNFDRSIIFLCEHNDEGTVGFVLNQPSEATIGSMVKKLDPLKNVICIGGPVQQDTLHYVHSCEDVEGAIEIVNGIYWGGDFDELIDKINLRKIIPSQIKFFLGYSGWSPSQLKEEIKANSWIVSRHATKKLIFETEYDAMWRTTLKKMGGRYSMYANYPLDPTLN